MLFKDDSWRSGYQSVSRLLRHLRFKCSGSLQTLEEYCWTLYNFCQFAGKNPEELVALSKDEVEKLLEEYYYYKREHGCSVRTANGLISKLATFFRVNGFKGDKDVDVGDLTQHWPTRLRVKPEYIPMLEEAHKMADAAGSLRNRAIILFLLSTGLRTSSLCALTYGDIKEELEKGVENPVVRVYPEMRDRVPGACKRGNPYHTYASKKAVEALRLYLEERRRKYGEIRDEDPLFASEYNRLPRRKRNQRFLTPREIQVIVKEAARRAGIKDWMHVTPKCLRKTYEHVLRSERVDGTRLDYKTQEFLMGHVLPGSQDAYYDKTKIEELRAEYAKLNFNPNNPETVVAKLLGVNAAQLLQLEEEDKLPLLQKILKILQNARQGIGSSEEAKIPGTATPPNFQPTKKVVNSRQQRKTGQTTLLTYTENATESGRSANENHAGDEQIKQKPLTNNIPTHTKQTQEKPPDQIKMKKRKVNLDSFLVED